ncbi:asparagine synthase-related protein [Shewanella sp. 1CM18E]|uniref:asparagine synthetase B family protein n=1 Tax=Shewanella sp. 1CM18E TaxID=2929169 RepID=UPI0020C13B78|nr:asparagine synthase-related protein [Shewanella sp. 1CM18E]MCK8045322.1 asparagine synthase-related protein [Shewanella sp. 1CM18E]
MCGVALLYGTTAVKSMPEVLGMLSHRGPDDQHYLVSHQLAIGFVRLAINDESIAGRQPYRTEGLIGAFNCEVYNAKSLAKHYNLTQGTGSDALVIAPLFNKLGSQILAELDGFYSGIIYESDTNSLYLLRDHMGKKPLFYGRADDNLFVVSELKALKQIEWFEQVPIGISKLDLATGVLLQIAEHSVPAGRPVSLQLAMEEAVVKRLPTKPFGIFLSGGLDSSIIATIASKYRKDITYFVLGEPENADVLMVNILAQHLGLENVKYIPLPLEQELPALIAKVLFAAESYNPSIISNGLATYILAEAAKRQGIKVVLTGEGADELFGGYHEGLSELDWQSTREKLIADMCFTELRRLDKCSMAHGVEARCPFLDRSVKCIADNLEYQQFYLPESNKVALREAFRHLLPAEIANRKKTSFDVGSGVRKLVVSYLTRNGNMEIFELRGLWQQAFTYDVNNPYFSSYPTFDAVIATRGVAHR